MSFRPPSPCLGWHACPALARFRPETEDGPEHSGRGRRSDLHTTHAWFRGALHSARYVSRHSRGSRPRYRDSSCGRMSPSALPAPSSSRRNRGLSPIPLRGEALFKVIHPVAGIRPAGPPLRRALDLKWLRQTRVAESDYRDRERTATWRTPLTVPWGEKTSTRGAEVEVVWAKSGSANKMSKASSRIGPSLFVLVSKQY